MVSAGDGAGEVGAAVDAVADRATEGLRMLFASSALLLPQGTFFTPFAFDAASAM
jgi:hypothetical protein